MLFIIKLFPEISIKSKPVRARLNRTLESNIRNVFAHHQLKLRVESKWDRLIVRAETDTQEQRAAAVACLAHTPGIHSFLEADEFTFTGFDDLFAHADAAAGASLDHHTFALRVKRRGQHPFTSQDVEREVGGRLQDAHPTSIVKLKQPQVQVDLEIDGPQAFVITHKHKGLGGYPVGTQGTALALISGGFDSGVAAYQALRRGLKVGYLFFNLGGTAHEIGVMQESYYLWDKFASSHRVPFISVPFAPVVGQILERVHHGVRGVILKRMMMKTAALVAARAKAEALITGESLGQVSSQTLINLGHITKASSLMILRPLVCADKQDIIDEAQAIGTAGFAESMPEYCGVISDHPNVCPSEEFVLAEEAKLDADAAELAAGASVRIDIKDIPLCAGKLSSEVEVEGRLMPGEVVIDVRTPEAREQAPLKLESNECLQLPFYKLISSFEQLDKLKTYVLYCDQGVMSMLQAKALKQAGHHNVKVWRPEAGAPQCPVKAKA